MANKSFDNVSWLLGNPITNFCMSIVDDSVKANADLHYKAGMSPKIVRTTDGKCCEWCSRLAGVYEYDKVRNTGNEVFRRHRNCGCIVEYYPGDGKVQNVHTKEWVIKDPNEIYDLVNEIRLKETSKRAIASRARDIRTLEQLSEVSQSGIIYKQEYTEVVSYFKQSHNVIVAGFESQDFEGVKITLAGVDDFLSRFSGVSDGIRSISFDATLKDYGRIDELGNIKIGPKGIRSYGTGIHESAHAFDQLRSIREYDYSEQILVQARKRLGLRANSKIYIQLSSELCGYDIDEAKKSYEVLAYALETELGGGKGNMLSNELLRLVEE